MITGGGISSSRQHRPLNVRLHEEHSPEIHHGEDEEEEYRQGQCKFDRALATLRSGPARLACRRAVPEFCQRARFDIAYAARRSVSYPATSLALPLSCFNRAPPLAQNGPRRRFSVQRPLRKGAGMMAINLEEKVRELEAKVAELYDRDAIRDLRFRYHE